jgi:hypothetical protein
MGTANLTLLIYRYDFIPSFRQPANSDRGGVWAKIPLINNTLNMGTFEWVLWMDFDTLFTNLSIRIEDFMEDIKLHDLDPLNTGQQWSDVSMIAASDWFLPSHIPN